MADVAVLTLQIASSQAEAAAKRTEGTLKRLDMTAEQLGRSFQRLGLKLTAALTVPFALSARAAIKASSEYEKARISFGVFLDDMQQGARSFNDIVALAARTPLTVSGLQKSAQILLATGAATAQSLIPMLKSLGDISRADSTILERLSLNLGQVASQGRLTGRELRDFAVAGVPLLQTLAKQMNKTTDQIRTMISRGEIGFKDVVSAFTAMSSEGGKFNNLMAMLANTVSGKWSTAIDNIRMTLATFADQFKNEIKAILDFVITTAQRIRQLTPQVKRLIAILAGVAATIGPVLIVIGGIITGVAALKASFIFLGIAIVPIAAVMLKIALIVGALIVSVEVLRRSWGITWTQIGSALKQFAMNVLGFLVNFRQNWSLFLDWFANNWKALFTDAVANFVIFVSNLLDNMKIGVNGLAGIIGAFTGWMRDNWEMVLGQVLERITVFARDAVKLFFDLGTMILKAIQKGVAGGEINLDIFNRLLDGFEQKGSLADRINAELKKIQFKSLADGFQKSFENLPEFNTAFDFFQSFQAFDEKAKSVVNTPDDDSQGATSTKLASALEAGSSEAFKLLTNRSENKVAKRNLSANEQTAFAVKDLKEEGVKIQGLTTIGTFK